MSRDDRAERRQRRAVLSEEEYTTSLSDIVQRDYFPDLPSLRRQVAVLDRRAVGDFPGAVAIRRAARQLEEHEQALADEDVEAEQQVGPDSLRKTPRPLHRESVTGFHARVTSEDNDEFDQTQRREIKENRHRLQQVFSNRITNGSADRGPGSETPLLASDKFNAPLHRIEASEWKDTETGTNGLFFNPQHIAPVAQGSERKRITNGCRDADVERQLMPPPARVQKSSESSGALVLREDMVEYVPKHATEKQIEPSRTRFPARIMLPPPPQRPATDSSTDYSTEASTDLDAPMLPLSVERQAAKKRQKRDQETLVSMTPLLVPGRSAGSESPIVTWGTVSSTPMVLGGMDRFDAIGSQKSFVLPAESERDDAARKAEAKLELAKSKMKQNRRSRTTPMDHNTASLTPTARSLLAKTTPLSQSSARLSSAFGSALRNSYTPKRKATQSSSRDHAGKVTPRISSGSQLPSTIPRMDKEEVSGGNVTDGLLKLPNQN
jgi:protein DGCR14